MLQGFRHGQFLLQVVGRWSSENKKADVAEHPEALQHVGLLVNEPTGTASLLFNQSSGELELSMLEATVPRRHHAFDDLNDTTFPIIKEHRRP